jgi:hypothetical protein
MTDINERLTFLARSFPSSQNMPDCGIAPLGWAFLSGTTPRTISALLTLRDQSTFADPDSLVRHSDASVPVNSTAYHIGTFLLNESRQCVDQDSQPTAETPSALVPFQVGSSGVVS